MKNLTRIDNKSGFTLLEVLIALVVFAVGILGVASMQISSIQGNNHASRVSVATSWGENELETLMALPFDDAALDDVNDNGVAGLGDTDVAGSLADGGPVVRDSFTVFWNIADNYPAFGTKTIRVIVRRNDRGNIRLITQDFTKMEPI